MKRITSLLIISLASLTILACEKSEPAQIPEPQKEEKEQPEENNQNNNDMTKTLYITIGGVTKTATLVSNSSTKSLLEQLQKGDISYEAHDYGNFEKVGPLGYSFPENNSQVTTEPGDVILYQGNNLCIYYDKNSWNFTRIGKLDNMTQAEIKTWVKAGGGNVIVKLSLK